MLLALKRFDLVADRARLLLGIPGAGDGDFLAWDVFGVQRLAEAAFVVRDKVRGGREDMTGRTIVALQPDDLRAGEVVLEAKDVIDLGAAPAVNRLVVVATQQIFLGGAVVSICGEAASAASGAGNSVFAAAALGLCASNRSQRYCATFVS